MWNQSAGAPGGYYGHASGPPPSAKPVSAAGQKHDVFVGNLAFSTTEEQLYAAFSELGRIVKVRMVSDQETGKPRGFAFVEFEDPQAALSAIRNMNDHLETLANQLGMDMSHAGNKNKAEDKTGGGPPPSMPGAAAGSRAVAAALKSMNKGEMYDVVAKLKEVADSNPDEARKLLTQHPQLPEAILYCMSELDMIKTPVPTATGMAAPVAVDPRARMGAPPPMTQPPPGLAAPSDPRAARDPRAAARDPRAAAGGAPAFPPPPMMQPPPTMMQQPPAAAGSVAGLDPNLVQQVMALTPAQIAQLPPDKQQSILALRQQIAGGVRR
ncbi:hypothetical protein ACHAXT_001296 [Thalassiosira profunda]